MSKTVSNKLKQPLQVVKGSAEPPSRKIYKRSDIVNLMIKDPERYKANVDEFDRAYREGRVK